jgi:hypothetical protein
LPSIPAIPKTAPHKIAVANAVTSKPLPGAGEAAFFRSNHDRYAELAVYSATHYLMLQVSVPTGKTAEAIKPDTVKLANAIIATLK